jgi:hypothetical protein
MRAKGNANRHEGALQERATEKSNFKEMIFSEM